MRFTLCLSPTYKNVLNIKIICFLLLLSFSESLWAECHGEKAKTVVFGPYSMAETEHILRHAKRLVSHHITETEHFDNQTVRVDTVRETIIPDDTSDLGPNVPLYVEISCSFSCGGEGAQGCIQKGCNIDENTYDCTQWQCIGVDCGGTCEKKVSIGPDQIVITPTLP